MSIQELKLRTAEGLAEEYWTKHLSATEPDKRREYALKYEFWADVRDKLTHGPHSNYAAKGCGCGECN